MQSKTIRLVLEWDDDSEFTMPTDSDVELLIRDALKDFRRCRLSTRLYVEERYADTTNEFQERKILEVGRRKQWAYARVHIEPAE